VSLSYSHNCGNSDHVYTPRGTSAYLFAVPTVQTSHHSVAQKFGSYLDQLHLNYNFQELHSVTDEFAIAGLENVQLTLGSWTRKAPAAWEFSYNLVSQCPVLQFSASCTVAPRASSVPAAVMNSDHSREPNVDRLHGLAAS